MTDRTTALFRLGAALMRGAPAPVVSGVTSAVAKRVPRFLGDRTAVARSHQQRARPEPMSDSEVDDALGSVFATYGRYFADTARLAGLPADSVDRGFSYEGFEYIEDGVAAGNGTILVLPHLGGWEWAGSWLTKVPGYDVSVVVESLDNEGVREFMHGWRESIGMEVLTLGPKVGAEITAALKKNHIVCLMSDRNLGDGGVGVTFFGEETELPGGAATLALRTGAAIVPLAVYHRGDQSHAVVHPQIAVEREGRLREDVTRITQLIADEMETLIRMAPEQWIVLQPNWPSDHR